MDAPAVAPAGAAVAFARAGHLGLAALDAIPASHLRRESLRSASVVPQGAKKSAPAEAVRTRCARRAAVATTSAAEGVAYLFLR